MSLHAMHGKAKEAHKHFEWMCEEGVWMSKVTFVSPLSACSHAGFQDEGLVYFDSMGSVYGVSATVKHCECMVDLLDNGFVLLQR